MRTQRSSQRARWRAWEYGVKFKIKKGKQFPLAEQKKKKKSALDVAAQWPSVTSGMSATRSKEQRWGVQMTPPECESGREKRCLESSWSQGRFVS